MAIKIQSFETPRTISHGQRWGNFVYNAHNFTLRYEPQDYEIDLEDMGTSAAMLDTIFQMRRVVDPGDMTNLIEALYKLSNPQRNLCSGGQDKQCNPKQLLRTDQRLLDRACYRGEYGVRVGSD